MQLTPGIALQLHSREHGEEYLVQNQAEMERIAQSGAKSIDDLELLHLAFRWALCHVQCVQRDRDQRCRAESSNE